MKNGKGGHTACDYGFKSHRLHERKEKKMRYQMIKCDRCKREFRKEELNILAEFEEEDEVLEALVLFGQLGGHRDVDLCNDCAAGLLKYLGI